MEAEEKSRRCAAAGGDLRAALQRQTVGVDGGLEDAQVVDLHRVAVQHQVLDAVDHVAQHTHHDTLREGGVVLVHVGGQLPDTIGSLVLYSGVVLAQRALNGVVGVLCQIQF